MGFYTKVYSGQAHTWVNNSLGGFFYVIFWILFVCVLFPRTKPLNIAIWIILVTCAIEFLQLLHPPFLEMLRENFIGRTILGNSFNWGDFPYYFFGSLAGYFILKGIEKIDSN
jgi:hypothetical protein